MIQLATMETASTGASRIIAHSFEPEKEKIKRKLLKKGVFPTPKIIHTLRKKEIQKANRKAKRIADKTLDKPLSESQKQVIAEESHFQTISREYELITKEFNSETRDKNGVLMVGKPWEGVERAGVREIASVSKEYSGEKLKREHLQELSTILAERNQEDFRWLLDDDIEEGDRSKVERGRRFPPKRQSGDGEADGIRFLVHRLCAMDLSVKDWKFSRLIKQSGLQFTERNLLRIVEELGTLGSWRHALSVVEWVYNLNDYKHYKSRFVYTKLLAVLGKARRPSEALHIFNLMREDCQIYPDMPAYHSIAVTLGQAGLVKELMNIIECMRQKPSKRIKNMRRKNWDTCLEPDLIVFNAVLNACVPSQQWKGVSWVLEHMRKSGLKPNGATYGLAMEVMLQSGKYNLVHKFFGNMRRSGEALKAITYKVLVRAFWEEGKINEAVEAVRDMEQRGVVGTASVYYELACCLCNNGRWQEAIMEVEKLKKLPLTKPLEVTFTGMIMSCMDGGHVNDCISIFEYMKDHCTPNIGTINAMLKVYGRYDMFAEAKELFEETKRTKSGFSNCLDGSGTFLEPDIYTYYSMLEASASAHQWEYFESVYKEMTLCGYQLDQNKHVSLLVEASKAGKWHLLEHAFDTILEAGEIPHPSFFMEMVCQITARHNYEAAVTLINSMVHAPFQVSEKQWTDLFRSSSDRIDGYGLQNLLDALHNSDVVTDATVTNLLRSLQSLCILSASKYSSSLISLGSAAVSKSPTDDNNGEPDNNKGETKQVCSLNMLVGKNNSNGDLPDIDNGVKSKIFYVHRTSSDTEDGDNDMMPYSLNYDDDIAARTSLCGQLEDPADDVASSVSANFNFGKLIPTPSGNSEDTISEAALDILTSEVDDSCGSDLPSASEILETWKESRQKDGIFFPFQFGCKPATKPI